MSLPQMSDYQAALQSPEFCFFDPVIKKCKCETNAFGVPKAAAGNFALTYCLYNTQGKWAVRCFHKESSGLEARYNAISDFLQQNRIEYFSRFEYQAKGILVNGSIYPIVKMDWLHGDPLNLYIEKNLRNVNVLERLINELRNCINTLERYKVSHGDLQHGNILISNNQIKLVDYDGVYVPNLHITRNNELGHANYQHPLRDENIFGERIDRFSAIVIFITLKALQYNPSLWGEFENGDNLLFVRKDFLDPSKSTLILKLLNISAIKTYIQNFINICKMSVISIPSLDDFIGCKPIILQPVIQPISPVQIRTRQYPVISSANKNELLRNVGNVVEVVGKITAVKLGVTKYGKPYYFLNFGDYKSKCFTIVIWSEAIARLQKKGISIDQYRNKWVSIVGLIANYKGRLQIEHEENSKINILKDQKEATDLINEGSKYVECNARISDISLKNANVLAALHANKKVVSSGTTYSSSCTSTTSQNVQTVSARNQNVLDNINRIPAKTTAQTYSPQAQQKKAKEGCYIATAIYGDYYHPKVYTLRLFRDKYLLKYRWGVSFVREYYRISPILVHRYKNNKFIIVLSRGILDGIVFFAKIIVNCLGAHIPHNTARPHMKV